MKPHSLLHGLGAVAVLAGTTFLAGCAATPAPRGTTGPAAVTDPALLDPRQNSALRPVPRDARWVRRHESFVEQAKQGGVDVLFVGDSITDFWRDTNPNRGGRSVWEREFAPLHAANIGISGDRTQHVLWRLQHGEVEGLHPRVVVLMIGTNNTGFEPDKVTPRNTPAQVAEGVKAIVRELRTRLPGSKILLLAIFPRGEQPSNPQREQIAAINREIAGLADHRTLRFLDLNRKFLRPDGTLPKDIMPDFLHPNLRGYEIWAAAMKPTLLEMLR